MIMKEMMSQQRVEAVHFLQVPDGERERAVHSALCLSSETKISAVCVCTHY